MKKAYNKIIKPIALRFAWLSVWLRKKDTEMIDLEIHYLRLLMNNIADLRYSWGIAPRTYSNQNSGL